MSGKKEEMETGEKEPVPYLNKALFDLLDSHVLSEPNCPEGCDDGLSLRYLDGKLTEEDVRYIIDHLQSCDTCKTEKNIEEEMRLLLKRCCEGDKAPTTLKVTIQNLNK